MLSLKDIIMSYTDTLPVPRVSKILNASKRLKSGFKAHSILQLSSSLSKKMLSLRTLENSDYSILSNAPLPPPSKVVTLGGWISV